MKTIKANVYRLSELDPKVKETVIERSSQLLVAGNWYTPILEDFRENMKAYGVIDSEPYFSGFYSQGDGACFICNTVDTDLLIRKLYETGHDIPDDVVIETKNMNVIIQKTSSSYAKQYDHENTVEAVINYEGEILSEQDVDKLSSVITEWVREESRNLHASLEKYYEELTSDSSVEEFLSDSYFFTDGRIADRYIINDDTDKTLDK